MSKKNRRKAVPMDPAEIARRASERRKNPGLWGVNEAALALPSNAEVVAQRETRQHEARAKRYDVFGLMFSRNSISLGELDAVRRFQSDLAIQHRVDGSQKLDVKVDRAGVSELVTQRSIDAGKRLAGNPHATPPVFGLYDHIGPILANLALKLSEPDVIHGQSSNWRVIVKRETGEHRDVAQGAIIQKLSQSINEAYQAIDKGERKAA